MNNRKIHGENLVNLNAIFFQEIKMRPSLNLHGEFIYASTSNRDQSNFGPSWAFGGRGSKLSHSPLLGNKMEVFMWEYPRKGTLGVNSDLFFEFCMLEYLGRASLKILKVVLLFLINFWFRINIALTLFQIFLAFWPNIQWPIKLAQVGIFEKKLARVFIIRVFAIISILTKI